MGIRESLQRLKQQHQIDALSYNDKYFELFDVLPLSEKETVWYADIEPKLSELKLKLDESIENSENSAISADRR